MKFTYAPESRPLDGFTIKRAVHRGHFGEVYFAISDAGKEVALKLLRQDVDVELRGVTQCLNLKHPHLVTIFDIKQDDDGDHWIVMEFVGGQRLDQVLDDYPRGMPMEKVLAWLNGLTEGLTFMHNSGIVHRDLKPANLFWDHGHVKIGDVGLSKVISPSKKSAQTQSVGTVYYMAPEVAHGKYGRTVDVYSLGVILVEMLTGRLPFEGETVAEILFKHLTGAPDLSMCPAPVRSVLARALEKDPEKRIASVQQLRDEFVQAVRTGKTEPYVAPSDAATLKKDVEQAKTHFTDRQRTPANDPDYARELERRVGSERYRSEDDEFDERYATADRRAWSVLKVLFAIPLLFFVPIFFLGSIRFVGGIVPSWATLFLICAVGYFIIKQLRPAPYRHRRSHRRHGGRPPSSQKASVDDLHFDVDINVVRDAPRARPAAKRTPAPPPPMPLSHRIQNVAWEMVLAVISTGLLTGGLAVVSSQFGVDVPFHETVRVAQGELIGLSTEWDIGMVGFFAAIAILSAWGLLLPVRLAEWRDWDGGTCRLVSGVMGILVGTAAYLLDLWLLVPLRLAGHGYMSESVSVNAVFDHLGRQALYDAAYQPTWFGYALFFFMLFALVRWWKQGTAFRPKRFRMWAVITTACVALLISGFWAFPMYWGITWAAVISSVVQLSSVNYGRRR